MRQVEATLRELINSVVSAMGYELVGCELFQQTRRSLLRIYIDQEKGITVDDCEKVSRQVSAVLDVEDPIKNEYTLEVSSPGINRPLFEVDQYQKNIGKQIKLRVGSPINDRRNFVGKLLKVENTDIHLLVDAEELVIPISSIDKANLVVDIKPSKP